MAFSYVGNFPNQQVSNSGVLSLDDINNLESNGELGGSLELIQSQSVSGVGSCNFTSIKGNKYDVHLLEIINLFGATDNTPTYLRFSNDGGSTYEAGTSYQYAFQNGGFGNGTFEEHRSTGTSAIFLGNNAGNGTNESSNFYCYIYNANNSSKYTFATHQGVFFYQQATAMVMAFGGGVYPTAETINAFQILKGSGNITSATIKLYGVKQI